LFRSRTKRGEYLIHRYRRGLRAPETKGFDFDLI
jgi:hypothetical protein